MTHLAPLHHRVERADAGLVAVNERAAHVDDEIPVPLVKPLQHRVYRSASALSVTEASNEADDESAEDRQDLGNQCGVPAEHK